jgi:putative membrane protein
MLYNVLRAAHIIFVIALMAGLLIYPRYKIHQLSSKPGDPLFETMKEASNRLRRIILNPSLILVWLIGLSMLWRNPALLSQSWMHLKLALVLFLSALHGWLIGMGKKVDAGLIPVTPRRLRMVNEVPFLVMILVVVLAVVEPF